MRQLFGHGVVLQWSYVIQTPMGGILNLCLSPSKTNAFLKAEFCCTYPGYQVEVSIQRKTSTLVALVSSLCIV